MPRIEQIGLTARQVQDCSDDGFVSPHEPETWTQPVVRLASKASLPFIEACQHAGPAQSGLAI